MEWDKLRVFYHVAKHCNITRAAEKLNISQPALTKSIQYLEARMQHMLFQRTGRGLVLTEEGHILFAAVEKMFVNLATAKNQMENVQEPRGVLKVATTVALVNPWLVELVPDFLDIYPDIELEIIGSDERLDMKTREADVSIRPFMPDEPTLIHDYLYSCCMQMYASPEYLKKWGVPQTLKDLDHHKLITYGDSTIRPYRDIDWHLRIGLKEGEVRKPYMVINSPHGAARLAENGVGIMSLCKEYPYIDKCNLVPILPDVQGPTIDVYYVYPKTIKSSKRIKVFGEYLKSRTPDNHKIRAKIGYKETA